MRLGVSDAGSSVTLRRWRTSTPFACEVAVWLEEDPDMSTEELVGRAAAAGYLTREPVAQPRETFVSPRTPIAQVTFEGRSYSLPRERLALERHLERRARRP